MPNKISDAEIDQLKLSVQPLIGVQFDILRLPRTVLGEFEPSQIGTIVGTLMDACIPKLSEMIEDNEALKEVGIEKHEGILGDREGYPDYRHVSGKRMELKLLYVDPVGIAMKKPPTPREPSARLTQKVTVKNVDPALDVLFVVAYQLQPAIDDNDVIMPTVIDFEILPMIDCIFARDKRLSDSGGKWFGDYETPAILSKIGRQKVAGGMPLEEATYGRKESEGKDYNEDTNFGKLKRIPYEPLQLFLKKHGANYAIRGSYPHPWIITNDDA